MTEPDTDAFDSCGHGAEHAESDRHREAVGSVAEEAAKLFAASQQWAQQEHGGDGAAACRYCPICMTVEFLRSTSPEVMEHLESAGLSLLAALRTASEQRATQAARRRSAGTVDKIDLSEDLAWD
jgi:hypothetical protein